MAAIGAEQQVIVRLVSEVDAYAIGDESLELPAKLTRYGLSELVNHLLGSSGKPTPFDFLLDGELLRSSLTKFMQARGISGEATLELRYFPLVREPEKISQNANDEWVSAVDSRRSDGCALARAAPRHSRQLRRASRLTTRAPRRVCVLANTQHRPDRQLRRSRAPLRGPRRQQGWRRRRRAASAVRF
jgi:hypothetical protein